MAHSENLGLGKTHTPKLVASLLKQLVYVPAAPFYLASRFFQHYPNDRGFYTNFTVLGNILIFGASFDTILVLFISIFMTEFFQTILYIPLFNGFVGVYALIPDVGIVILIITVLVKLALYPLNTSSIQAQRSLQELQPKLDALKKKHKDNQQVLAQETMKLYKEHKVNPLGSCLPLLIQLPIFIALYWVLQAGLTTDDFSILYSFVPNPGSINPISLGLFDLSKPQIVLALLAGGAQYWQAKSLSRKKPPKAAGEGGKDESMAAMMNKQMLYFMPVITVVIGTQLPGGLSLYWFLSTLFMALQQVILSKKKDKETPPSSPSSSGAIEGEIVS